MMSVLLVFLLFAVLQVAIFFYVRTIVSSAAADGARYAANVGVDSAAGGERASQLVGHALSGSLARDVPCVGTVVVDPASGIATSEVRCEGRIRSIFFPIGSLVTISADAHSLREVP
jgi:Flp pilus assembly protein TadG